LEKKYVVVPKKQSFFFQFDRKEKKLFDKTEYDATKRRIRHLPNKKTTSHHVISVRNKEPNLGEKIHHLRLSVL